jgi:hypothetical protein
VKPLLLDRAERRFIPAGAVISIHRSFALDQKQVFVGESGMAGFGSKADMCSAKRRVRFTPNSDRQSGCAVQKRGQWQEFSIASLLPSLAVAKDSLKSIVGKERDANRCDQDREQSPR